LASPTNLPNPKELRELLPQMFEIVEFDDVFRDRVFVAAGIIGTLGGRVVLIDSE
jgi:hypothetical protein